MPRYTVFITRTLTLTTNIAVRAKNDQEASDKVQEMIDQGDCGTLNWSIEPGKVLFNHWQEEEHNVQIDSTEDD